MINYFQNVTFSARLLGYCTDAIDDDQTGVEEGKGERDEGTVSSNRQVWTFQMSMVNRRDPAVSRQSQCARPSSFMCLTLTIAGC